MLNKLSESLLFIAECLYANAHLILFVLALAFPFILLLSLPAGD